MGVRGDVAFGEHAQGTRVLRDAGQSTEALLRWLLRRPVRA